MTFVIVLDRRTLQDIQQAIDYYNVQEPGLGEQFESTLNKAFQILEKHPFYQIRYDKVHCLPLKNYPYMIHYTINEENLLVKIIAVLNTRKSSDHWKKRV